MLICHLCNLLFEGYFFSQWIIYRPSDKSRCIMSSDTFSHGSRSTTPLTHTSFYVTFSLFLCLRPPCTGSRSVSAQTFFVCSRCAFLSSRCTCRKFHDSLYVCLHNFYTAYRSPRWCLLCQRNIQHSQLVLWWQCMTRCHTLVLQTSQCCIP